MSLISSLCSAVLFFSVRVLRIVGGFFRINASTKERGAASFVPLGSATVNIASNLIVFTKNIC